MPRNRATYVLFTGLSVFALAQSHAIAQEMDAAASIIGEQAANQCAPQADRCCGIPRPGEKIGAVSEVLIDRKGVAKIVVIDVGGFLGIGRKHVGVAFDAVKWIAHEDRHVRRMMHPEAAHRHHPKRPDTRQQTDASLGYPDRAIVNVTKSFNSEGRGLPVCAANLFRSETPYGPAGPLDTPDGPGTRRRLASGCTPSFRGAVAQRRRARNRTSAMLFCQEVKVQPM